MTWKPQTESSRSNRPDRFYHRVGGGEGGRGGVVWGGVGVCLVVLVCVPDEHRQTIDEDICGQENEKI